MRQGFFRKAIFIGLITVTIVSATSYSAHSAEEYRFDRMWPTLQQPWYFHFPYGIAVDARGCVYVADTANDRIQKFTTDGKFMLGWGTNGSGEGQFNRPNGVVIDASGYVYVADTFNSRIQKFTSAGEFVATWGSAGSADGQLAFPEGIAVDGNGYVYVAEERNHRIQKFTSTGEFVTKWGSYGTGNGQFDVPYGIAVDGNGYVYVVEEGNHRIQKFNSTGEFVGTWGSYGTSNGRFDSPDGIAVDGTGYVYVADTRNGRVQKFTSTGEFEATWGRAGTGDGEFASPKSGAIDGSGYVYVVDILSRVQKFTSSGTFISAWQSSGSGLGQFDSPDGIALSGDGHIYVADRYNHRIQEFTSSGQFVTTWGSYGIGEGQFDTPDGVAVDGNGYVYVTDPNNCSIQKFTSTGTFVATWGSEGSGQGQFGWSVFGISQGIAIDTSGYVYVVDTSNCRIQKFTSTGDFMVAWGSEGSGEGQFGWSVFGGPSGIATDASGYVYVVDTSNCRIQKFTSTGDFVATWGEWGSGNGEFDFPRGIAVDGGGYVYVADYYNNRIQKFTASGQFVATCGNAGSDPGSVVCPTALTVDATGRMYVCDTSNNRVQVFKPYTQSSHNKAIVVAGGGPYQGNQLWDATSMCANFAYRTLTYQGFTKESIFYLSSDTDLDLDGNGVLDDVDADATNANLQSAITTWASGADDVVLYLVDHGGDASFRMSSLETLRAADLDSWLDQLQQTIRGKVIVIYDACESGSFLSNLTPPSGKQRIVISSTSPGESAYFVTHGSISFSNFFWTHVFNGLTVFDAFDLANQAIGHTIGYQTPLLDDNGNGTGNEATDGALARTSYIGNGTVIQGEAPVIGSVSPAKTITGTSSASLFASQVTDSDGIARTWAVIRPPDYVQSNPNNPVQELPSVELMPMGSDRFEGTYGAFNTPGTYQVAIYALDRIGNTAIPKLTTVSVNSPLTRKAVIVAGGPETDSLWQAIEKNAVLAYEALTYQGYTNDTIYFMAPVTISAGVDGLPTISNLQYAVSTWAAQGSQDLVLYLVGNGGNESFKVNATETLSATNLDSWLDSLQSTLPGKVTVIYDGCQSGSFLPVLTPPAGKDRILMASTGSAAPAYFLSQGSVSFSNYFWKKVLNGTNLRDSFIHAKQAITFSCVEQTPTMDDNRNGIGNEREDGQLARSYTIGAGVMLAGDDPMIGSVSSNQTLNGTSSASIVADQVTTTGRISEVFAVITPPNYQVPGAGVPVTDLPIARLWNTGGSKYEGSYNAFCTVGEYQVAVYGMDDEGTLSLPKETTVTQNAGTQAKLFFPHNESTNGWNTEIGLINVSEIGTIIGSLIPYDNSGTQSQTPISITLAPQGRREVTISTAFTNPATIGYLVFESSSEEVKGYSKFALTGQYRAAVPALWEITTGDIYLSHLASTEEWWTKLCLVNTTNQAKTITLQCDTGESATINLAAKEHKAFLVSELFNNQPTPTIKSGTLRTGGGVIGLELFCKGSQMDGIPLTDDLQTSLYFPHVASDQTTWWTGVVAYNPNATQTTITITPYTAQGTALSSQSQTIGSKGRYFGLVSGLGVSADTAWFKIESTAGITGFELFGTNDATRLAGFRGIRMGGQEGVFAKLEENGWTGIAFVNNQSTASQVTLTAYDDSGTQVATATITLNPYEKKVAMAEVLFTQDISAATYISYRSTQEVVGFQLNNTDDNTMLDALPGL